ncbi:MAG: hypothetical protein V6Z82_03220 [Flavobacteriales bacterium]
MRKLHENMSREAFENGYFYTAELRRFAKSLGIAVSNLKKDEIELHIKARLFGYAGELPVAVPNRRDDTSRDLLRLDSRVVNYVDDRTTKDFLLAQLERKHGPLPYKSGQWYWLNDWRKEQIRNNRKITYRELIDRLYELMTTKGRLPRIPSTRFNNFITDFLADPENEGATRQEAMDEWERLKKMPVQKNYQEYKSFRNETA